MPFYSQIFSSNNAPGQTVSALADSVLYVRNEDRVNLLAARGAKKNIAVPVLDTDGIGAVVFFNNAHQKYTRFSDLTGDRMIQNALRTNRVKQLYVLGRYPGQPGAYFDRTNNIHVSSILQYSRDDDILPRFITSNENIYEGYTPLGLFTNDQEYDNMSLVESNLSTKGYTKDETQAVDNPQSMVGDEFTRSYDAPGLDPSTYWLSNKL